jgi:DNA polymerase-3 subunit gamma/tau
VKFIFATTEVGKVPVTVLSRCQRFDLRRIPAETLAAHFAAVAHQEGVEVEPDALAMIARAAEGSARDGLSILDQAIAHGAGAVTAEQVRGMIGLADRGRIRRLLDILLSGDAAATLAELDEAHALGIDPAALLRGLMEELHSATRAKAGAGESMLATEQREAAERLAGALSWGQIHRLWQLLLKGLADVQVAPDPTEAATMALLRLIHASELPDPSALIGILQGDQPATAARQVPAAAPSAPTASLPADFPALVAFLEKSGRNQVALQLHDQVGLVRYVPGELAVKPLKPLGADWPRGLAEVLKSVTGTKWAVSIADDGAQPSLLEQEKMAEERVRADVLADPNVAAVLEAFPEASLESFAATKGA